MMCIVPQAPSRGEPLLFALRSRRPCLDGQVADPSHAHVNDSRSPAFVEATPRERPRDDTVAVAAGAGQGKTSSPAVSLGYCSMARASRGAPLTPVADTSHQPSGFGVQVHMLGSAQPLTSLPPIA